MKRFLWPLFWTLLAVIGTSVLCVFNPTAREVIGGAALSLFQVVTSPFILETTLVLIGICVVLALSQRRQDLDSKDEWVYLDTATSGEKSDTSSVSSPSANS